ncbi:uncharacterized protein LOC135834254 isoform X2 [Planococcus citri]
MEKCSAIKMQLAMLIVMLFLFAIRETSGLEMSVSNGSQVVLECGQEKTIVCEDQNHAVEWRKLNSILGVFEVGYSPHKAILILNGYPHEIGNYTCACVREEEEEDHHFMIIRVSFNIASVDDCFVPENESNDDDEEEEQEEETKDKEQKKKKKTKKTKKNKKKKEKKQKTNQKESKVKVKIFSNSGCSRFSAQISFSLHAILVSFSAILCLCTNASTLLNF